MLEVYLLERVGKRVQDDDRAAIPEALSGNIESDQESAKRDPDVSKSTDPITPITDGVELRSRVDIEEKERSHESEEGPLSDDVELRFGKFEKDAIVGRDEDHDEDVKEFDCHVDRPEPCPFSSILSVEERERRRILVEKSFIYIRGL